MSPRIFVVPRIEPIQFFGARRGAETGIISARGLPNRVTRNGCLVFSTRRTSAKSFARNSDIVTSFMAFCPSYRQNQPLVISRQSSDPTRSARFACSGQALSAKNALRMSHPLVEIPLQVPARNRQARGPSTCRRIRSGGAQDDSVRGRGAQDDSVAGLRSPTTPASVESAEGWATVQFPPSAAFLS